ncbi:MAG TPA: SagB/ThcOx family dehydrogenase [Nitrospira sp.]|nr:SagB/ThcOx family dehydrogenase [Nitrospira sp.]
MTDQKPFLATHTASADPVERVIRYHIETKHHFHRYARSLGFLDWANQPDPFRRYIGSPLFRLPLLHPDDEPLSPSYEAIYQEDALPCQPITLQSLSRFFELSLALSAWKKAGESEWALRSNPSSGNLHPTEGYVILPQAVDQTVKAGLYHYAPREHGLELRAEFHPITLADALAPFPQPVFLFGLSSVHWREAWKYGERAFRYCNHDIGHAIGAARIAAATLGWTMVMLDGMAQDAVALLLGTDRTVDFTDAEQEHPDCLAAVWPHGDVEREASGVTRNNNGEEVPLFLKRSVVEELVKATWHGKANRLSRDHAVHWDIIDGVAEASWKSQEDKLTVPLSLSLPSPQRGQDGGESRAVTAGQIIRQRRSAVSFDGKTSIPAETFFRMMQRVMPATDQPQLERPMPWDAWTYAPAIHLMLFVHRVDGLTPGLYFLVRDAAKLPFIQGSMNPEINWVPAPSCPDGLPLFWLLEGDARKLATQISCHQDIAGDSAFSFGMLAEFEGLLRERGAWWYPRLFWEAGLVGQILYLEAEAAGVRATGIGCFFDDPVHEIVAIKDLALQSLYHFTIGGPVEDRRLTTLPPYKKRDE